MTSFVKDTFSPLDVLVLVKNINRFLECQYYDNKFYILKGDIFLQVLFQRFIQKPQVDQNFEI